MIFNSIKSIKSIKIKNQITPFFSGHALPTRQFHALFTLFTKCCFIFPSRYLFAIGLLPILCLGWRLPPVFGLHSQAARLGEHAAHAGLGRGGLDPGLTPGTRRGCHPLWPTRHSTAVATCPLCNCRTCCFRCVLLKPQVGNGKPECSARVHQLAATDSRLGPIPLHSPLLRESLLVSFPPLNDMLKSSG